MTPVPQNREHFPASVRDEQALLCALIIEPSTIPIIAQRLKPSQLFREVHRLIYLAICDLFNRGIAPTAPAVAQELEARNQFEQIGGEEYLYEISQVNPTGNNGEYHAGVVYELWRKRTMLDELEQARERLLANGQTTDQLLNHVMGGLGKIESSGEDEETGFLDTVQPWPEPLDDAALIGIAGDVVRLIDPHTESDPAAILFQFLAGFGNLVARKPHWRVEATRHGLNLFTIICGTTSKARKGTSFDNVVWILERLDPIWRQDRVLSGYSSGEGLIQDIADDHVTAGVISPGVQDKRLFWVEGEFGGALTIMARDGNTLPSVTRLLWDGKPVAGRSKNRPVKCLLPHVSIVGHITLAEANDMLSNVSAANGFGNRFLWVCARRSKLLPDGGAIHTVNWEPLLAELRDVMSFTSLMDPDIPIMRNRDAKTLWHARYRDLSEGRPGLLGAMIGRAEAQVMRLATLYAVLDRSNYVSEKHLNAGLACWDYCEQSARYIFGDRMGNPQAERVLKAVTAAGITGLSRNEINRKAFSGKLNSPDLDRALSELIRSSLIEQVERPEGSMGRPAARWRCKQSTSQKSLEIERSGALSVKSPSGSASDGWKPY